MLGLYSEARMQKRLAAFVLLFGFWLLLTWSVEAGFLVVGLLLCAFLGLVIGERSPYNMSLLNPVRWFWFLLYVPYFFYYCVKANLDVAYRVLHPDVPIRPGIVKVRTELTTELGKTFLANSITLTPGTLTVDIVGQDLYVHWINVQTADPDEQTRIVVKRFEGLLKRIFE